MACLWTLVTCASDRVLCCDRQKLAILRKSLGDLTINLTQYIGVCRKLTLESAALSEQTGPGGFKMEAEGRRNILHARVCLLEGVRLELEKCKDALETGQAELGAIQEFLSQGMVCGLKRSHVDG